MVNEEGIGDNNSEYSVITTGSGFISDKSQSDTKTLSKSQKKRLRKKLKKLAE